METLSDKMDQLLKETQKYCHGEPLDGPQIGEFVTPFIFGGSS